MRNNMKKIPLIITALLLISAIFVPGASAAKLATTIRGDADGNGKVNINDVTAIQRHCAQLETLMAKKQTLAADVDGNGYITIDDATYIQEYLERNGYTDAVDQYELEEIQLNVLDVTRTFVDKLMSIKRHAICGSLGGKVRHIYDVYRLYSLPEVQAFLKDKDELKRLMQITKETDSF